MLLLQQCCFWLARCLMHSPVSIVQLLHAEQMQHAEGRATAAAASFAVATVRRSLDSAPLDLGCFLVGAGAEE